MFHHMIVGPKIRLPKVNIRYLLARIFGKKRVAVEDNKIVAYLRKGRIYIK